MDGHSVKVTVLCENTVGVTSGIAGEWGLSLLLEAGGQKILFDTGENGSLISNAAVMGVDLSAVNMLVMSHGHFDHTGGMQAFLRLRGPLPVCVHPDFFALHYGSLPKEQYIGLPYCREELASLGADFIFTREPKEIVPGVWVSGEVPRVTDFEQGDGRFYCVRDGKRVQDSFLDDMSIYAVTSQGLVVLLGCAHSGLVNIIEHAIQVTGVNKIYGILGGTHLGPAPARQQEKTIAYLGKKELEFIAANHCTGLPMACRMASSFGPAFHFAPAGSSFTLPLQA